MTTPRKKPKPAPTQIRCWRCKTVLGANRNGEHPTPDMVLPIIRGSRKVRYLQFCPKCGLESVGEVLSSIFDVGHRRYLVNEKKALEVEETAVERLPPAPIPESVATHRWKMLRKKLLFLMNFRCQICGVYDKEDVEVYSRTRKFVGRELMRHALTLCSDCHSLVGGRLGVSEE